jgi:hypothetical protein
VLQTGGSARSSAAWSGASAGRRPSFMRDTLSSASRLHSSAASAASQPLHSDASAASAWHAAAAHCSDRSLARRTSDAGPVSAASSERRQQRASGGAPSALPSPPPTPSSLVTRASLQSNQSCASNRSSLQALPDTGLAAAAAAAPATARGQEIVRRILRAGSLSHLHAELGQQRARSRLLQPPLSLIQIDQHVALMAQLRKLIPHVATLHARSWSP